MSTLLEDEPVVVDKTKEATPCDYDEHAAATWSWLWSCGCVNNWCDHHDAEWRRAGASPGAVTMCPTPHRCVIHLMMREPIT